MTLETKVLIFIGVMAIITVAMDMVYWMPN
jgi:hypothetical protein